MTPIALRITSDPDPSNRQAWRHSDFTFDNIDGAITQPYQAPPTWSGSKESMSSLSRTVPASDMPAQLSRGLSQQELDAAQQLIEHSQSIPRRHSPESTQGSEQVHDVARSGEEMENGASSQEHHDLRDSLLMYQHHAPYSSTSPIQDMSPAGPQESNSHTVPAGQMCR